MTRQSAIAVLALAALGASLPASAAPAVPDYVRNAPGAAARPNDDGLILAQSIRITLDAEGKVTRHERTAVKMLQEYVARHEMFDPRIDWNDARSSLHVDEARTYMADGTAVDAGANSLVANTAPELQWAIPYAHMRQMVISHVAVEHGATSVLAYTIADRKPSGVPLWDAIEVQGPLPILDQSVTVEVPEGTNLSWGGIGWEPRPEVTTRDGITTYAFHRRDVPASNVAELASGRAGLERLVWSTAGSWAEVRSFLEKCVENATAAGPAVLDKVEEVVGGSSLGIEKVARIHSFVVDGLQTVAWPTAAFDYDVRPADEVLQSSVGHPLDKAALLVAMLRAAGIDSVVALASSERTIATGVPSPVQLDEVWVRARAGSEALWLDPTASLDRRNRFHLAGRPVLVLDGKASAPETQPELERGENRAVLRAELTIANGAHDLAVSGAVDLDLGGLYNPLASFDRSENRLERVVSGVVSSLGAAKAPAVHVGHQSTDLLALRAPVEGGALAVSGNGMVRIALPRVPRGMRGEDLQIHRERRTLPLVLPGPAAERVELVLDLPANVDVAYAPPPIALSNSVGTARREVRREGRKLTVRTSIEIGVPVVMPSDYSDLRALLGALEGDAARTVLLARRP